MAEGLRLMNIARNPRSALAITLFAGVGAIAGAGAIDNRSHNISGDSMPVKKCGTQSFNEADPNGAKKRQVYKSPGSVQEARKDIVILQRRALGQGGSINIGNDDITEIESTPNSLTLNFPLDTHAAESILHSVFGGTSVEHITFPIHNGRADVSLGAVACIDSVWGHFKDTGTFIELDAYVGDTNGMPQ